MTHFKHHTAICEAEIGTWGHSYTSILGFFFFFFFMMYYNFHIQ